MSKRPDHMSGKFKFQFLSGLRHFKFKFTLYSHELFQINAIISAHNGTENIRSMNLWFFSLLSCSFALLFFSRAIRQIQKVCLLHSCCRGSWCITFSVLADDYYRVFLQACFLKFGTKITPQTYFNKIWNSLKI